MKREKIYFISDLHLGLPNRAESLARERLFCKWCDEIKHDAKEIFIVGDLFDFWFEYHQVVPKGFTRTLGKLAELSDAGIPISFFTGNHDQWMLDYFETELNIKVYREPEQFLWNNKRFYIAHGDGLGKGDNGYKMMKALFTNPLLQWLFSRLHPNFAVWLGKKWSKSNRFLNGKHEEKFLGEEGEWLIGYSREILKKEPIDYFIYGHRHLAIDYKLNDTVRYVNLGDWLSFYSYAVFDGKELILKYYK
jgi:UDP-2,3-diacylglucosamine hydrolase